jgi:hypothetical protein
MTLKLTEAQAGMLRSVVHYVVGVPCLEYLEALTARDRKVLARLCAKLGVEYDGEDGEETGPPRTSR